MKTTPSRNAPPLHGKEGSQMQTKTPPDSRAGAGRKQRPVAIRRSAGREKPAGVEGKPYTSLLASLLHFLSSPRR